ncbi:MAG: tRNA nucleotidyltransferase [Clostridia bacterium]|nr:tRNA nucleotidyltransferase [Clostridia bacterium]
MVQISHHIPAYVQHVLDTLRTHGKRGYLVGGSLRDLLRGEMPHDFDLTANATPDEMLVIFKDWRVIPTGLAHGTVTVISEGRPIEITTHRTDGTYTDSRHPDRVTFTADLSEDLARRDFTVNAMAWSEETGLVDLFDGQGDLARGILRAVGDPETRFSEDALRILRCFRFAAQLDFDIEENTAAAAAVCAKRLEDIAAERITAELLKTLTSKAAAKGISALLAAGCAPFVFFDTTPDPSIIKKLRDLPNDAAVRTAALLHTHKEAPVRALLRRLHTSNAFAGSVLAHLAMLDEQIPATPYEARRFVCRHHPHAQSGLALIAAIQAKDTANAAALCQKVFRDGTAVEIRRLAVNGKELQDTVGVRPEKTATLLALLQDLVWQEPTANKKDVLLAHARNVCEKEKLL